MPSCTALSCGSQQFAPLPGPGRSQSLSLLAASLSTCSASACPSLLSIDIIRSRKLGMEMNEVRLETERLILRWFRDNDFDQYKQICADPEVMRFLGDGKPISELQAWRHMAAIMGHWYFRGYGVWAVEEKATGEVVGRIGLMNPKGWPGFELGWTLARSSWGKGYATEGA